MSYQSLIQQELTRAADVLSDFLKDSNALLKIEQAASLMAHSIESGGKIISCFAPI